MPRGGKTARSKEQVLLDRVEIAKRYLQGQPQHIIGASLNFDRSTISRELKQIRAAWLESSLVNFNDAKARELAKIDHLEETHWDAWNRSIGQVKKTTQYAEPGPGNTLRPARATITTEESIGNPAFLTGVQWCIQKRLDIFGLEAPKQFSVTERDREIAKLLEEWTSITAHGSPDLDSDTTVH
jgi:hypothetical protein